MFIIKLAIRKLQDTKLRRIQEGFYAGRKGKALVLSNDLDCARQFNTFRGARQSVRRLWKDYEVEASLVSGLDGYVDKDLMRFSEAEQRWVIA